LGIFTGVFLRSPQSRSLESGPYPLNPLPLAKGKGRYFIQEGYALLNTHYLKRAEGEHRKRGRSPLFNTPNELTLFKAGEERGVNPLLNTSSRLTLFREGRIRKRSEPP